MLAAVAMLAAGTVVALTTVLHRASSAIAAATESVHLTQEAKLNLLLLTQVSTPIVRRDLVGSIQRRLSDAEAHVSTANERAVLDKARGRVREYARLAGDSERADEQLTALHAAAYSALDELVTINVTQAAAQVRQVGRIDYVANVAGLMLAVLVLCCAVFFLYWVRGPMLRPFLDLARAVDQFAHGDVASRASVTGPREIKEMCERFNAMAARLEKQKDEQRAFLAGVAHDLRNPVAALLLCAETGRLDASLPPDHRARQVLDRVARQLRNLDRMIGDFLDAALIEAGSLELRLECCDLAAVVRSAVELFDHSASRHELILSLPSSPLQAWADPLRIEQVASNLISNALKYSPDGAKVEVRLELHDDHLILTVTDHGLGMSQEDRARLFQPFRRGLSREDIPGVGLGLFVVRRIVEAHRGRIEVESSPGAGSTFRILLPTSSSAALLK